MAKKKTTKKVIWLGHLQAHDGIPESQRWAIARLARDGYGYRQIFSLLRGVPVGLVSDGERDRFGEIARFQGAGVNRYRMLQDHDAVEDVVRLIRSFPKSQHRVLVSKAVITALVLQRQVASAKRKKKRKTRKAK